MPSSPRPWAVISDNPVVGLVLVGLFTAAVAMVLGDKSPAILFAVPIFFVGLAASIRYPLIALSALLFVIMTNASQNLIVEFGLPSISKLAAPGLFFLIAARFFIYGERPYIPWVAGACLLTVFSLKLISSIYADGWELSITRSEDFMKDLVVAILALAFMSQRRGLETITVTASLSLALLCALGLYQLGFGRDPAGFYNFAYVTHNNFRFEGAVMDGNFTAAMIVFTVPLALFQLLNARGIWSGVFWALISALLIAGLIATQSRGGLIAFTIALLVLGTTLTLRQFLTYAVLLVFAGGIAATTLSSDVRERFSSIADAAAAGGAVDNSTEGRLASWQVAYNIFQERPMLGVGVGNFKQHYQNRALKLGLIFRGEGRSTHSLYLEFLAETGLIGLCAFLIIVGIAAMNIIGAARKARAFGEERVARHMVAIGAGFAGLLFAMLFLHDSIPRFLWLVVAIAVETKFIVQYHYGKSEI